MANTSHLDVLTNDVAEWNDWRLRHQDILPDLSGCDLRERDLRTANLSAVNLSETRLTGANLFGADLYRANLYHADLREANLSTANLFSASLCLADLSEAILCEANLSEALLVKASLREADLRWARLDRADLREADLTGSRIYGISACNVNLEHCIQSNLRLSEHDETVLIDHLEMAQFIYLVCNTHITPFFDGMVLLVGRFSERSRRQQTLVGELRRLGYMPVVVNLNAGGETDVLSALARIARFMLLDLTHIREFPPSLWLVFTERILPVQPLREASARTHMVHEKIAVASWIRPLSVYRGSEQVRAVLRGGVLLRLEEMVREW
jgi:Pentapeptide repeats (8 copies)